MERKNERERKITRRIEIEIGWKGEKKRVIMYNFIKQ